MFDKHLSDAQPRCYIVLDIESAVIDEAGHRRYQAMERWTGGPDEPKSRRGHKPEEDSLKTPRWPFQTIAAVSVIVLFEHCQGSIEVSRFETFAAPDLDERGIVLGLYQLLSELPERAEVASWGGGWHDFPLLKIAALRHGLSLPQNFKWMAWSGEGKANHIDLCRVLTGGSKMKPVHLSEYAASLNVPAKITAPPFAVAGLIKAGDFESVIEVVEGDVITTALILARWRKLLDPRARCDVAEDRILRQIEELRGTRRYIPALRAHREMLRRRLIMEAANDPDPVEAERPIEGQPTPSSEELPKVVGE